MKHRNFYLLKKQKYSSVPVLNIKKQFKTVGTNCCNELIIWEYKVKTSPKSVKTNVNIFTNTNEKLLCVTANLCLPLP